MDDKLSAPDEQSKMQPSRSGFRKLYSWANVGQKRRHRMLRVWDEHTELVLPNKPETKPQTQSVVETKQNSMPEMETKPKVQANFKAIVIISEDMEKLEVTDHPEVTGCPEVIPKIMEDPKDATEQQINPEINNQSEQSIEPEPEPETATNTKPDDSKSVEALQKQWDNYQMNCQERRLEFKEIFGEIQDILGNLATLSDELREMRKQINERLAPQSKTDSNPNTSSHSD